MGHAQLPVVPRRFGETLRPDRWWVQPVVVFLILSAFIVYATWAAFQGEHYTSGPYLSPFYSPELFGSSPHAWFGPKPSWWPGWLVFSPALLILPFPGLFRLTCYYYRGAYYKAFWADPPACAVGEPRKRYAGEAAFPLILQNIHRYSLYIALLFIVLLACDVYKAMWFTDPATGETTFGIGVGTLVLAAQRDAPRRLHPGLSLPPSRRGRLSGPALSRSPPASGSTTAPAASTAGTCAGPGPASSPWRSPTCTCGSARWGSGRTGEFCEVAGQVASRSRGV